MEISLIMNLIKNVHMWLKPDFTEIYYNQQLNRLCENKLTLAFMPVIRNIYNQRTFPEGIPMESH